MSLSSIIQLVVIVGMSSLIKNSSYISESARSFLCLFVSFKRPKRRKDKWSFKCYVPSAFISQNHFLKSNFYFFRTFKSMVHFAKNHLLFNYNLKDNLSTIKRSIKINSNQTSDHVTLCCTVVGVQGTSANSGLFPRNL